MYGYSDKDNKPPCYKCVDRKANCHSNCERYIEWKNELHDKKKWLEKQINPPFCRYFKKKSSVAPMSKKRDR